MIDPPSGWRYGFPKEIPDDVDVTDVNAWLIENGYPKKFIDDLGEFFTYRIIYKDSKNSSKERIIQYYGGNELVDPYGGHGVIDPPPPSLEKRFDKMKKNVSNKKIIDGLTNNYQRRKYLPTLSELIDRLSIAQLKEVFIPKHKKEYSQEIKDILHDIDILINASISQINAETIRAIVVLSQMNLHIWHNESNYRKGIKNGNNLELTHGLNGIRNTSKNKIQEVVGGRKDYKIDCLAADFKDWEISW
jgi:hypothetical protein